MTMNGFSLQIESIYSSFSIRLTIRYQIVNMSIVKNSPTLIPQCREYGPKSFKLGGKSEPVQRVDLLHVLLYNSLVDVLG